jgi:hypothetical protein
MTRIIPLSRGIKRDAYYEDVWLIVKKITIKKILIIKKYRSSYAKWKGFLYYNAPAEIKGESQWIKNLKPG